MYCRVASYAKGIQMKIKKLLWCIHHHQLQLFYYRRGHLEIKKWDGDVMFTFDISKENNRTVLVDSELEHFKDHCWNKIGISSAEYISSIILVDRSFAFDAEVADAIFKMIQSHNGSQMVDEGECIWEEEDIQTILNAREDELLIDDPEIGETTIAHATGTMDIVASEGTKYIVLEPVVIEPIIIEETEDTNVSENEEISKEIPTPIVSQEETPLPPVINKPKRTRPKGVPQVCFPDTTPKSEKKKQVTTITEADVNDELEESQFLLNPLGKNFANNQDLSKFIRKRTEGYNHGVKEPE